MTILVPPLLKLLLTSCEEHRGSKVLNVLSTPPSAVIILKPFGPHLQYLLEGKWIYTFDPIQTPYPKGWNRNLLQRTLFYRQELLEQLKFWVVLFLNLKEEGKIKKLRIAEASLNIQIWTLLPAESCSRARGWAVHSEWVQPSSYPWVISWAWEEVAWLFKGTASRALLDIWLWHIPRDRNRLMLQHVSRMGMWVYYSSWWKQHMFNFMKT